jgi:chaperonin GroES
MQFRPLHDRVVIEALEAAQKVGSILLPDTAQEKPQEGKVVAVGPGQRNAKGALAAPIVKTGDRVIYGKWSGSEIKIQDKSYLIVREADILGVVEGAGSVSVRERGAAGTGAAASVCTMDHVHGLDCCDD